MRAYLRGSVVAGKGGPKHWGPNQAVGESQGSGYAEGHAA